MEDQYARRLKEHLDRFLKRIPDRLDLKLDDERFRLCKLILVELSKAVVPHYEKFRDRNAYEHKRTDTLKIIKAALQDIDPDKLVERNLSAPALHKQGTWHVVPLVHQMLKFFARNVDKEYRQAEELYSSTPTNSTVQRPGRVFYSNDDKEWNIRTDLLVLDAFRLPLARINPSLVWYNQRSQDRKIATPRTRIFSRPPTNTAHMEGGVDMNRPTIHTSQSLQRPGRHQHEIGSVNLQSGQDALTIAKTKLPGHGKTRTKVIYRGTLSFEIWSTIERIRLLALKDPEITHRGLYTILPDIWHGMKPEEKAPWDALEQECAARQMGFRDAGHYVHLVHNDTQLIKAIWNRAYYIPRCEWLKFARFLVPPAVDLAGDDDDEEAVPVKRAMVTTAPELNKGNAEGRVPVAGKFTSGQVKDRRDTDMSLNDDKAIAKDKVKDTDMAVSEEDIDVDMNEYDDATDIDVYEDDVDDDTDTVVDDDEEDTDIDVDDDEEDFDIDADEEEDEDKDNGQGGQAIQHD